jgi:hypothetical protein
VSFRFLSRKEKLADKDKHQCKKRTKDSAEKRGKKFRKAEHFHIKKKKMMQDYQHAGIGKKPFEAELSERRAVE